MEFTAAFDRSAFYQRDQDLALDTNQQYISNLKKLGYWEFDMNAELQKYMKNRLTKVIDRLDLDFRPDMETLDIYRTAHDFQGFLSEILDSTDYELDLLTLKECESRAKILSKCGYEQFYNLCTDDELAYLGW
jgi:hypothetical protein